MVVGSPVATLYVGLIDNEKVNVPMTWAQLVMMS